MVVALVLGALTSSAIPRFKLGSVVLILSATRPDFDLLELTSSLFAFGGRIFYRWPKLFCLWSRFILLSVFFVFANDDFIVRHVDFLLPNEIFSCAEPQ